MCPLILIFEEIKRPVLQKDMFPTHLDSRSFFAHPAYIPNPFIYLTHEHKLNLFSKFTENVLSLVRFSSIGFGVHSKPLPVSQELEN